MRTLTFRMLHGRLYLLLLLSLFALRPPLHAEPHPVWPLTGPAFSHSVSEIRAAAGRVRAEPFMEATVLFERDAYALDAAGRMTYRHTLVYRIETGDGVDDWSEIRMRWSPWYQDPPRIRARAIAVDGKVTPLDEKTITDGPAREDSEDTYTDERVRKVPLPALAPGVIVEEETALSDRTPFFAGGEIYSDAYARSVPILRAEMIIDLPASTRFRYKVHALPDARVTSEVAGGVRHFSLEQGYLPAVADSDIDLPTHEIAGPYVAFSTGDSWAAVADAYRRLAEARIEPERVRDLVAGPPADRLRVIERIVARLHREVRYTGIEFGEASLQPAAAGEVLKHHYGDCKDKAALLVSMLRSRGIAAYLALLDTGPGDDVDPELPGMNDFDHAIVYVPQPESGKALWIDATDEFAEVGTLPVMDEGRRALVIREGSTGLIPTPSGKADDDRLVELRQVALSEYGPAKISETSMTHGDIDTSYRSLYGEDLSRETRADLEKYAETAYMAKSLAGVEHGEARDLSRPFQLRLEMTGAQRGSTGIEDAVVGIPFSGIFYRLPKWFRTDPRDDETKLTAEERESRSRAVAARVSEYDVHPFATEWRYTVTIPRGFVLRGLPEDRTTQMGPATLSEHFEADPGGDVRATLRFETSKPRYTSQEALDLRAAVRAAYQQDIITIRFDQAGSRLLAEGRTREALAADRALIAGHPANGLYHARLAFAYLKAGVGDAARREAEEATRLDPDSPVGFRALGRVCQFNEIGVRFGPGFDWSCAARALRRAVALDPEDTRTALSLAILDEYDSRGERYTPNAHLEEAIAGYRAVAARDRSLGEDYEDNVLIDLFAAGRYKELLGELATLPESELRRAFRISATVALEGGSKGVAAGLAQADRLSAGLEERNRALGRAGSQLLEARLYPEASKILAASVSTEESPAATEERIALFGHLAPWKSGLLPASDPRSVVQRLFLDALTGRLDQETAAGLLSRQAYGTEEEWSRSLDQARARSGSLRLAADRSDLPARVLLDLTAGTLKISAQGDDASGYRMTLDSNGRKPEHLFVTREGHSYRVVADGETPAEAGNEALYLLRCGRTGEARSLLDWVRGLIPRGGGDDPLSGPVFPRLWTVGDPADRGRMEIAALALVATTPAVDDRLGEIRAARERARSEEERVDLALLLAYGYRSAGDGARLKEAAGALLARYPDSATAIDLAGSACGMLKQWEEWRQMLDSRLAQSPGDAGLLRLKVSYAEASGRWELARTTGRMLIERGMATPSDYDEYARTALFDGEVNDEVIQGARQAAALTGNASFAELHTLACIYAVAGKTAEARDLLLKAMAAAGLSTPNADLWLGFGEIYEQYGITDAAVRAYAKVERPLGPSAPTSNYLLAQARLSAMKKVAVGD